MQINSINYSLNYNKPAHKTQNFEGLWGKTSKNTDFDAVLGIPKVEETSYYYPFSDESKEEIDKVVKENTSADIDETDGSVKYKINECRVCNTLPFKKNFFEMYSNTNEYFYMFSKTKLKLIHNSVKDKYLNNGHDSEQISASNEYVTKKLDIKS